MIAPKPADFGITDSAHTDIGSHGLAANVLTGLCTDYLNHFAEAVMLLDAAQDDPRCGDDFLCWTPKTYHEHFEASPFAARAEIIAAYEAADPALRQSFEEITIAMVTILTAAGRTMRETDDRNARGGLARQTAGCIRPLMTLAAGMITRA